MIIDAWMQHPTKRFISHDVFETLRRWNKQATWASRLPIDIPISFTLKEMDKGEVEKGALCAWSGPGGELISNKEVAKIVKKHRNRFFGIGCVNLAKPMQALDELKRCVEEEGFKGLRIVQWLWEKPCTHPLYYPLYAECVRYGIPICLQVGLTGPLQTFETGRPLHIERVALDFPDLKIVCGHIGYPWHQEMIAFATKFPNVYIDTSAYKVKRYPRELVQFIKTNGKKKVLFGTNFPMISPSGCLEGLESLDLEDETKELFFRDNAIKVFSLDRT